MEHRARVRRRIAYPLLTLCVAGVIWLLSTGQISMEPQVQPAVYESFVREVVEAARRGQGQLAAEDDFLARTWRRLAPAALQTREGGAFEVQFVDTSASSPDVVRDQLAGQPVAVRLASGEGVLLSVRFFDGNARVVGVGVLDDAPESSMRSSGDE